ncbi:MAG TPA: tetratricopeptide repeat protein [Burkholderiales bacterium]|nr:tetratricopeptide repeat protein [Burkholderiales bacterium]
MIIVTAGVLVACANPLNRATSDRYARQCSEAYREGLLDIAEEACYRAAVNVNLGNLGPELKSERWFNLALIKRQLRKLNEAEDLLKESLRVEETLSGPSSEKIARRLAELAAVEYQKAQYAEGYPLMDRLAPMSELFSGRDRLFIAALYYCYATQAEHVNDTRRAAELRSMTSKLGPVASNLKCSS